MLPKYSTELVEDIFIRLRARNFPLKDLQALEFSGFLEKYLWPHLFSDGAAGNSVTSNGVQKQSLLLKAYRKPDGEEQPPQQLDVASLPVVAASALTERNELVGKSHVLLIALMFVEKFRDAVDGWNVEPNDGPRALHLMHISGAVFTTVDEVLGTPPPEPTTP